MPAFDLSVLLPYLPEFMRGLQATLFYSVCSVGLALRSPTASVEIRDAARR